jgi:pimeloyl-ACP methyl ester carboxylesterase
MAVNVTERMVQAGEVRLNVASAGDGPPVVLLHGFPDSWQLWRHQFEALAADYRVIAPDLRGFGRSDRPSEVAAYRIDRLVHDVAAVCADARVARTALVGHDWGAGLAWQVAFRRPDLVDKLAVLSVGHGGASAAAGLEQHRLSWYMLWFLFPGVAEAVFPSQDWRFFRQWAWDGARPGENPECERQIADLSRPGALTAALNWYRANIRPETFVRKSIPSGPRVACPTLGIWSSGDPFLGEAQMRESGAYIDGPWRYERVDGNHWIPSSAPEGLNRLLRDFLASP